MEVLSASRHLLLHAKSESPHPESRTVLCRHTAYVSNEDTGVSVERGYGAEYECDLEWSGDRLHGGSIGGGSAHGGGFTIVWQDPGSEDAWEGAFPADIMAALIARYEDMERSQSNPVHASIRELLEKALSQALEEEVRDTHSFPPSAVFSTITDRPLSSG